MKPASPQQSLLSRRTFLRGGALAATGGMVFPHLVPSTVFAAAGEPGANDRIGIGIIGMGRQAGDLLRNLVTLKEARLVAVADVNLPRAQAVARQHRAAAMQDFRQLLERKEVDAIITATPEHWRSNICLRACQAGKDLYVEKPMSLTIREGRLMVEAARKYQRVFQTGSQQRSMFANRAGCEAVRSGKIGPITRVIAHNYPSPWENDLPAQPVPEGLDWDLWCGPTEPVPFHKDLYTPRANPGWLSFRPYSGGEMTGWGSHGLDQVQSALGMDVTGPVEVWVEGPKFSPPRYAKSESRDRGNKLCGEPKIFYRYANGTVMELSTGPQGGAIFIGEKGRITINRGVFNSEPAELAEDAMSQRPRGFDDNHMKNWLKCVRSREKPIADVEIGHRSATVCHLGNIARWLGRKLKWDPVKEVFPDDAEANGHLDRARRKPWELPEKV